MLARTCLLPQTITLPSQLRTIGTMARQKGPRRPPAPKRPPLTHFLCLPLVTPSSRPQLEASLGDFRDDVSRQDPRPSHEAETDASVEETSSQDTVSAVHPKAIRPVGALHFTLGVMSLDRDKLLDAVDFLKGVDVQALLDNAVENSSAPTKTASTGDGETAGPSSLQRPISPPQIARSTGSATGPLTVNLQGLQSMHNPNKTSILYVAPQDLSGRLYNFCLALQKLFKDKDFLISDDRQLKLHATVVNTIYAKGKKRPPNQHGDKQSVQQSREQSATAGSSTSQAVEGHGPHANAPLKIDATAILEKYKDFIWAENVVLDRVAICEMGAKKIMNADGQVTGEEYTEIASISLLN